MSAGTCDRVTYRPHALGRVWLTLLVPAAVEGVRRELWRFCSAECLHFALEDYLDQQSAERVDEARILAHDVEEEDPWP